MKSGQSHSKFNSPKTQGDISDTLAWKNICNSRNPPLNTISNADEKITLKLSQLQIFSGFVPYQVILLINNLRHIAMTTSSANRLNNHYY